jgi:hypothetical protein
MAFVYSLSASLPISAWTDASPFWSLFNYARAFAVSAT